MSYVDGVMLAVPTKNKAKFLKHAKEMAVVFKKYGAVEIYENWGSDVPDGKLNSMNSAVMKKDDETVVFSWIVWPDKAKRDEAWGKIMDDPAMAQTEMPYDGKRMIFGGFETIMKV